MAKEVESESTVFLIQGSELRTAIEARAARHKGEINECLETVAKILREKSEDTYESLLNVCVQAMMAIHQEESMTAASRVIKTQLERAAFLQNERIDLTTISRNINSGRSYRITVEEARRYGMS